MSTSEGAAAGTSEQPITSLTCAISGNSFTPSSHIVVTPSGHVCERRLLLSKLAENGGVDPFDPGIGIGEKDLVTIRTQTSAIVPPRASSSSFPAILFSLQEEYDGILLELFDTRNALEETRRELSQALYQNDAAVRVISRLTLERDTARERVKEMAGSGGGTESTVAPAVVEEAEVPSNNNKKRKVDEATTDDTPAIDLDPTKIPADDVKSMVSTWKLLSKARKKKTPPPSGHATPSHFRDNGPLSLVDKKSLHKTRPKGVTDIVTVNFKDNGDWVITGGNDRQVIIYDKQTDREVVALEGFSTVVTKVVTVQREEERLVLAASADGKVRSFKITTDADNNSSSECLGSLDFPSPIVGLEVQPTNNYVLVTSEGGDIAFCRLGGNGPPTKVCALAASNDDGDGVAPKYTATAVHPDGLILAVGTAIGTVQLWDLRSQAVVTTIDEFGSDDDDKAIEITSLDFSQNGYHLSAAASGGRGVHVYDVRKLGNKKGGAVLARLESGAKGNVRAAAFDPWGKFLAYGGDQGLTIVAVKEWDTVLAKVEKVDVRALAWSDDAKSVVTVSAKERVTKFWGVVVDSNAKNEEADDAKMKE